MDVARLTASTTLEHTLGPGRGGYLYVIEGEVRLTRPGTDLTAGDAFAVGEGSDHPRPLGLTTSTDAEVILVDVPLEWEPVGVWRGRV